MGLDISIKCQTVPDAMKFWQPDNDDLTIEFNGRMRYGDLVRNVGYTDKDYGTDKPITKQQAQMVVEYLCRVGDWNSIIAGKLSLWVVLGADITFQADW